MSPPAEKALPSPVRIATRTEPFASTSSQAAASAFSMSISKALSLSGRETVIVATKPRSNGILDLSHGALLPERGLALAGSVRPIGASWNRAASMTFSWSETISGNSDWSRICVSRSTPGAISVSNDAIRRQLHHAALGDIGDVLALCDAARAGEGDVLDRIRPASSACLPSRSPACRRRSRASRRH